MRWFDILMPSRRQVFAGCALVAALATGIALGMAVNAPEAEAQATRTFSGDAALMFHFVKPSEATAFEGVMEKVDAALDSGRQAQSRGWKVYRADNDITGGGNVMYVWTIDPVESGADYAVSTILNEALPEEVQALYEAYNGSYTDAQLKQLILNLDLVRDFGG